MPGSRPGLWHEIPAPTTSRWERFTHWQQCRECETGVRSHLEYLADGDDDLIEGRKALYSR
jgi:hypothetical protein